MRFLRIINLIYFLGKTKNKKRAVTVLNIGIFLTIFAVTTALISFYIEKKINKYEFGILEVQDLRAKLVSELSKLENVNNRRNYSNVFEYLNQQDNILLTESKYGSMAISERDYYAPEIYFISKSSIFKGSEIYNKETASGMIENSSKGLKEDLKPVIDNFFDQKEIVSKINFSNYDKELFDSSFSQLVNEIKKKIENKRDTTTGEFKIKLDQAYLDYNKIELFENYAIDYEEAYLSLYRGIENNLIDTLNNFENEILNYSNNERVLIFITFIIQFIIFVLIQFFELSSLPKNLIKKIT